MPEPSCQLCRDSRWCARRIPIIRGPPAVAAALACPALCAIQVIISPTCRPAHVLAILGAGVLIGQQVPRWHWPSLASYVAGLTVGFAAMIFAFAPASAVDILLAAAAISGILIALARPLPELLGCALTFTTGVTLALDSPPDVIPVRQANIILLGTFCGATLLLLVVSGLTAEVRREWQRIGVRILGSWIAASAMMVLALRLAP